MAKKKTTKRDYDNDVEDYSLRGTSNPVTDTHHHDGLKQLCELLDAPHTRYRTEDSIQEHLTLLTFSPLMRRFLEAAKKPDNPLIGPYWNLSKFAAQMISVGILMARREFGNRKVNVNDIDLDLIERPREMLEEMTPSAPPAEATGHA